MLSKVCVTIALFLAGAQAQQAANCQYQSLKCGSVLLAAPYSKPLSFPFLASEYTEEDKN